MTLVQFFFHLERDRKVVIPVEGNGALFFFERNDDPDTLEEYQYTSVIQEGLNQPTYFGFSRERLETMLHKNPNILEEAQVGEVEMIERKVNIWDRIKFFFTRRFY